MTHLPILSILMGTPLLSIFMISFTKEENHIQNIKWATLWTSVMVFLTALILWSMFDSSDSGFQFVEKYPWVNACGLDYYVGVDGISLLLMLMATFLFPLVILVSWNMVQKNIKLYMLSFLLLETLVIGTFSSLNLLLFYIFSEGTLIPLFLLMGIWGGTNRIHTSFKFFFSAFLGSLLMLIIILVIFSQTHTLNIPDLQQFQFSSWLAFCLWLGVFISFTIKIPLWPFHTWLPSIYVQAPIGMSMILAGVLLKVGGYGFIRFSIPLFPEVSLKLQPIVYGITVVGLIYASFVTLAQQNMKKLIAYFSIIHMGYTVLGIFSFNIQGVKGGIFQMISHGITAAGLLFSNEILHNRVNTLETTQYGGLIKQMPLFSICLFILILSTIGFPGTSGFIAKSSIFLGVFSINKFYAGGFIISLFIGSICGIWFYRKTAFGPTLPSMQDLLTPLTAFEKMTLLPLVAVVLWLGIYPKPLLKILNNTFK